jgi:uncharacterized protein YbjT (DUF2867 family)
MILVFGSSGTVGREVVKALSEAGEKVRAAYRSRPPSSPGVEGARVDLTTGEGLRSALSGARAVFLLTGEIEDQTAAEMRGVEAAREAGVERIVKLSVWGAEGEDYSFARIHRPVEREIEGSGIPWTHLRPQGFMQNFLTYYAEPIRTAGTLRLPCGEARVADIDARDIARVAALALSSNGHEGKAYDLTGPEALTFSEQTALLSEAAGKKITYVSISDGEFRQAALNSGMPEGYVEAMLELYRYYREGRAARVTDTVREVTGRDPISFAEFAIENASALR